MKKSNAGFNKIISIVGLIIFLVVEIVLYSLFVTDDLFIKININNTLIKFISIIFISFTSLIYFLFPVFKKKFILDQFITTLGLIFTFCADIFLLFINNYYEIGLIFFILVQLLYFVREIVSLKERNKIIIIKSLTRVAIFIVLAILLPIFGLKEILYFEVAFYFVNLVFNFIDSFINIFRTKDKIRASYIIFTLGLLLFILCDVCVGMLNLFHIGGQYIWLFYLPSQILILLSSLNVYGLGLIKYEKNN